jgi:hypothetical protein
MIERGLVSRKVGIAHANFESFVFGLEKNIPAKPE